MDRPRSRPLSPVPEEEIDERDENGVEGEGQGEVSGKKEQIELQPDSQSDATSEFDPASASDYASDEEALPIELEIHGLKAKVYLNCADVDIVPARYLEKADRSRMHPSILAELCSLTVRLS